MSDNNARSARRIGTIETRGIEPVPDSERHGNPRELFYTWFAANMGVLGITLGAGLVTSIGLNVVQALLVTVLGAGFSFLLCGLLSVAGQRGGAPGLTLSRAVFGTRGNWGPTLVSWLCFVGWETVMCTTAAFALLAVLGTLGVQVGTTHTVIAILITVVLAAGIGLFGHATIMWVQKWLTWIFGGLTLVVVVFLTAKVDWAGALAAPSGPVGAVFGGIGFIAAGTGLGWVAAGADYARYQPQRVRPRSIVAATVVGACTPLIVLITMGATMAVTDPGLASANDPVAAIGAALPPWMMVPYLLTAVFGLIAAADLSMYSSGLNLITGGIKVSRAAAVGVDATLITAGALYITVVAKDFYGIFTTFLTLLAVPLVAWAGVFLVDMIYRRHYDQQALLDTSPNGAYRYSGGIRWSAVLAWLLAIIVGLMLTRASVGERVLIAGPFSESWLGRHSLGWLVTGGTAAGTHAILRLLSQSRRS